MPMRSTIHRTCFMLVGTGFTGRCSAFDLADVDEAQGMLQPVNRRAAMLQTVHRLAKAPASTETFLIGESVEVKDGDDAEWKSAHITSLTPLEASLKPGGTSYTWDALRRASPGGVPWLTPGDGSARCPAGYAHILTEEECLTNEVAKFLRKTMATALSSSVDPRGCYTGSDYEYLSFNEHATGGKDPLRAPVCKKNTCVDVPGWSDGFGKDCNWYAKDQCQDGAYTGSAGAPSVNNPHLNCCSCGKASLREMYDGGLEKQTSVPNLSIAVANESGLKVQPMGPAVMLEAGTV